MSGHSKWSTIKRKKGVADAKRGAIFTKIGKLISVAARDKGGDPNTNFSLRLAIDRAKAANMPKDNIERAIKRGMGELDGAQIEELTYEGIGPANAQFIVKSLTDNKNRSAANIRHIFTKYGGSLATVIWNFEQKGVIRILKDEYKFNEDKELELIEAGAQDIIKETEGITLYTDVQDLIKLKQFLEDNNIKTESAEIEFVAKDEAVVDAENKEKIEKFIEELDDNEDVADYYTNVKL